MIPDGGTTVCLSDEDEQQCSYRRPSIGDHAGFTLIESMVIALVVAILTAVALPVFLNQRQRAWDAAAQSDLRVVLVAMELYRSDHGRFSNDALTDPDAAINLSPGVVVDEDIDPDTYCITATHAQSPNSWQITDETANVVPGDCTGP